MTETNIFSDLKLSSQKELWHVYEEHGFWTLNDLHQYAVMWKDGHYSDLSLNVQSRRAMELTLSYLYKILMNKKLKVDICQYISKINEGETRIVGVGESYRALTKSERFENPEDALKRLKELWEDALDNKEKYTSLMFDTFFIPVGIEWSN
jgi:hypothetical protein